LVFLNDTKLVSCSDDFTIKIFDTNILRENVEILYESNGFVNDVIFTHDEKKMISCS